MKNANFVRPVCAQKYDLKVQRVYLIANLPRNVAFRCSGFVLVIAHFSVTLPLPTYNIETSLSEAASISMKRTNRSFYLWNRSLAIFCPSGLKKVLLFVVLSLSLSLLSLSLSFTLSLSLFISLSFVPLSLFHSLFLSLSLKQKQIKVNCSWVDFRGDAFKL